MSRLRSLLRLLGLTGGLLALAALWVATGAKAPPQTLLELAPGLVAERAPYAAAVALAVLALLALPFHLVRLAMLLAIGSLTVALAAVPIGGFEASAAQRAGSLASLLLLALLALAWWLPVRARPSPLRALPTLATLAATAVVLTGLPPDLISLLQRQLLAAPSAAPTAASAQAAVWMLPSAVALLWVWTLRWALLRPAAWLALSATAAVLFAPAATPGMATGAKAGLLVAAIGLAAFLESVHRLAFQDELTGAASRRAFDDALRALPSRWSVALVDVDHFKKINDRHGHLVGDQVLRAVAARLRETRGAELFRYGGEEFALVFRRRSAEQAAEEIDRTRRRIAERSFVVRPPRRPRRGRHLRGGAGQGSASERRLRVRVSAGVAGSLRGGRDPQAVVADADKALYRAKRGGRNRVESAPVRRGG
ncbi:MAG: GGDEF domain-containing protein [Acidobacteria bacterium]|nr:MAG: GGDEF domain-containing protein [Acidobacteriota bacterium]REK07689.1 MAG: GGDEF domain-containing protein [Acidobacteriota bacterium]